MYTNFDEFHKDFMAAYKSGKDGEAQTAYNLYLHAHNNINHFCLMGRLADRDAIIGDQEVRSSTGSVFLASDDWRNFAATTVDQDGNVLKISDRIWSPAVNDAWTLGGIHGHSTFNVFCTTNFDPANIDDFMRAALLGSGGYPLSVTGREMVGLMCCREIYEPKFKNGALLIAPLSSKPSTLSFINYHGYVNQTPSDELWSELKFWLRGAKPL